MLKAVMRFDTERNEWVIYIVDNNSVLDCGCEPTRRQAIKWAESALRVYTASPGPHLIPDMYDRQSAQH